MADRFRVLLLHNIMAPYRFPLFRAIAGHPDIDLTVWFMSRSAKNRRWAASQQELGFKYEVLPSVELNYRSQDLFTYIVNYTFPWRYARHPFDVLISAGWLDFACQAGFFISKLLGRKFVLWSESTAYEPSLQRTLAAPLVKTMVRGTDACVSVGTRSKEYLHALGASSQKIFTAYSTVDVELFQRVSATARAHRIEHRAALGIRRRHVLLYCGQFIERKGLRYLLKAFALIKCEYEDVALVMVGYGPEHSRLLEEVTRLGLSDVHLLGHVEVADMPKMYALADVFVLPSTEETWGLVVNEAMACGLPLIVTDRVGSSVDLLRDGENGYLVPVADPASIADRTLRLLKDPQLVARMSECSKQRIKQFTPEHAAEGFLEAVRHAISMTAG
jgi:glycosyltransferase involved in cell wall biosynthesis